MIVDACNINLGVDVGIDDLCVVANNTTISSPIDQGTTFAARLVLGYIVGNVGVDLQLIQVLGLPVSRPVVCIQITFSE